MKQFFIILGVTVSLCQAGVTVTDEGHPLVTKVTSTLNTHGFEIFSGKGNI